MLTSGGDAPGMNAAIRAVTRMGIARNMQVVGIRRGYAGLLGGDMEMLDARSVGSIMQHGGTVLQTARCEEFKQPAGVRLGLRRLNEEGVEGLVVVGGNGSLAGAYELHKLDYPVVGIPASIDNDVWGTDLSIGVDTALNTMLESIDRIKDTASALHRAFVVEVMGRQCGYLALHGGIAGGAEVIVLPEVDTKLDSIAEVLDAAYLRGKTHAIVVVAEGAKHNGQAIAEYLAKEEVGFDVRTTILGHVQRGGSPSAFDRLLATRMGVEAVEALADGDYGCMIGLQGRDLVRRPLSEVVGKERSLDTSLYQAAEILAR